MFLVFIKSLYRFVSITHLVLVWIKTACY